MIIDCISDLHGHYPDLQGGDLLIVAGDLTKRDLIDEYLDFYRWLDEQAYKKTIIVAGNHDKELAKVEYEGSDHRFHPAVYLCDSGTEFEGLKIWGSPWTCKFPGINPKCCAFTVDTDEELKNKWKLIPKGIDILVTHCPPWGHFDYVEGVGHTGSKSLLASAARVRPKIHVFGHVHEGHGWTRPYLEWLNLPGYPICINASIVNKDYKPVNKPIRIEFGHIHEGHWRTTPYPELLNLPGYPIWVNASIVNEDYKPVFKQVRIEL